MAGADDLTIRDARPDEREAIHDLTLAAYAEFAEVMAPTAWRGLEQALRRALAAEEGAERIVAERHGRLVGSVMLFAPAKSAYGGGVDAVPWPELRLLAVAPQARGDGVGAALVRECVRRARASGARELGLHTSESLKVAMRMYERMGFVRAPEHDFQPPGAELVRAYRLPLDDAGA
ncbi:MAG TPA: GNAT family N-acetyltransferase [Longimicrobiaceae bacterium]|nr:GNAT family N-acetyltransferase [Longimicrobiaceae bacterium]